MFYPKRPSPAQIDAYLATRSDLPLTYAEVGSTFGAPPAGYVLDHNTIKLGEGRATFERACEAMRNWTMSRIGWVEIWPRDARIEAGTTVAVLARAAGIWPLFACRIIRVVNEPGPIEEFGFAYGTLPGHVLAGEERFAIRWNHQDNSVWYDLVAYSRPTTLMARLVYPLIRRFQRRFAAASLAAMSRAAQSSVCPEPCN
jgi:uncharacterized protein (UPF0548 family)